MISRQLVLFLLGALGLAVSLAGAGLLLPTPTGRALPSAGTDILNVSGQVSVVSRLGTETIPLTGTVTIERDDPRMEGGVEVVDAEIVAMDLTGTSVTGPVTVVESASRVSSGEIRSLQPPPDQFPASSFFNVFIEAEVPAAPSPTITLHNEEPFQLVPTSEGSEVPLTTWPPSGVTYQAEPDPCVPLLPSQPNEICVTSLSIGLGEAKPTPTPCPPGKVPVDSGCGTPTPTPTPCPPGKVPANGGCGTPTPTPTSTPTPTITLTPTPTPPSKGNDDFADAVPILEALPYTNSQTTVGATTEAGEPLNPNGCITVQPKVMGHTVWYRFTPSASGTAEADTVGSSFDTVLAAYTGSTVDALSPVACNDDASGLGLLSRISFPMTAGTTYHFQVGGFSTRAGNLVFNLAGALTPKPTPTPKDPDGDTDGDTIPNGTDTDDDSDGCTDEQELGSNPSQGGQRNPHNFWDYADMPDPNATPQRDGFVRISDVVRVLNRYGTDDANGTAPINRGSDPLSTPPKTGYHPAYDRGEWVGPHPWDVEPANGTIRVPDIVYVLNQYGHDCAD